MSSAVPIHPLLRLARRGAAFHTGIVLANPATSRASSQRLISSSSSLAARPSNRRSAKSNPDGEGKAVNAYSPASGSSSPSASIGDPQISPQKIDRPSLGSNSIAAASYAASARGNPASPPPASIKLTDKRSTQAKKESQEASEKPKDGAAIGEGQGMSKGASLHPAAVEQERKATAAAAAAAAATTTSSIGPEAGHSPPPQHYISKDNSSTAPQEEVGPSSTNSDDTSNSDKLAEGIVIPASRASENSSSSSTGPFSSDEGGNGGQSIPPRRDGFAGTGDDAGGPPVTTPMSELGHIRPPNPEHPFDTHAFIKRLQQANFLAKRIDVDLSKESKPTQETSLSTGKRHDPAEAIMEATRHLLVSRGERLVDHHLSKTEVDNQAYLFTAALSELRTELQVRARNDAAALRSMVTLLQREVDGLNQKMREDVASMKHDIQVDMNNRKSEAKEEQNTLEQEIQDLNNRFTISISDLKTEIEQNIKWDATRRALTVVFGAVVILIATLTAADYLTREEPDDEATSTKRAGDGSRGGHDANMRARTKSAEELGLVAVVSDDEGDGNRYV